MRVRIGQTHHRCVQRMKSLFHNRGRYFCANPKRLDVLMHDQRATGLVDRRQNGRLVEGHERPQVDDVGLHAFPGKPIGRLECGYDHRAIRDDRQVTAFAPNGGGAERHDVVTLRHRTLGSTIQIFMLEIDHRIVIADCRLQQSFGVVGCRGRHNLETRAVDKPGFGICE